MHSDMGQGRDVACRSIAAIIYFNDVEVGGQMIFMSLSPAEVKPRGGCFYSRRHSPLPYRCAPVSNAKYVATNFVSGCPIPQVEGGVSVRMPTIPIPQRDANRRLFGREDVTDLKITAAESLLLRWGNPLAQ